MKLRSEFALCLGLMVAVGCGKKESEAPPATQDDTSTAESMSAGEATPPTPEAPSPVAPEKPAAPTAAGQGDSTLQPLEPGKTHAADLDGDGKPEQIAVSGDSVSIGDTEVASGLNAEDVTIYLVDFNANKPKQQLMITEYVGEDSFESTIYVFEKGAVTSAGVVHSGSVPTIQEGLMVAEYGDCEQRDGKAYIFGWTEKWALRKGKLAQTSRNKSEETETELCPACPYVYVATPDGWRYAGEILRNLNRASMETSQSLRLPIRAVPGGLLRLKLAEEKSEITFLDDIYLHIDGRTIRPASCAQPLAYCGTDGKRRRLVEGDSLELTFAIPSDLSPGAVTVVAHGYYRPVLP